MAAQGQPGQWFAQGGDPVGEGRAVVDRLALEWAQVVGHVGVSHEVTARCRSAVRAWWLRSR